VKVYKTMVAIDDQLEGLKPGMSAEVTINADETPSPVLVVPIQSVVGTISEGAKRHCFVLDAGGQPELRDIECGMSNESLVEVKSGLKPGELVVQNPTPLLGEDSELKAGRVRPKHEDEDQGPGGEGGKKKKGAKKKNGSGPPPGSGSPPAPQKSLAGKSEGGAPSEAQKQAFLQKMRDATPAQRRDLINQVPQEFRDRLRQVMREQNLEVAN
jgi:hypothetical protein